MKMSAMIKRTYQLARDEVQNRDCVRCGATIKIADGCHECHQCDGLNNKQLIELRIERMQQHSGSSEIGKFIFCISTFVASLLLYSTLA